LRHTGGRVGWVESDVPAEVGNSGGPMVNSQGEVLGLATMLVGPNLHTALAASAEMIRDVAPEVAGR
jgi:S1-C subfamily serine protease